MSDFIEKNTNNDGVDRHRFVWPAFGLLVALAVWRLVVRGRDVAVRIVPVSDLDVVSFGVGCCGRVLWWRTSS
jgi:hypothetical protein